MDSPRPAVLRILRRTLVAAAHRAKLPYEFNDGWANRDEDNRRQNKNHQRGNHLDRSLCSLLFGALPAFRAEGIGMHAEGLGNAGAEAIGLDQCTHKRTDVVNPSSIDKVAQGFRTRLTGAQFEIDEVEFITQVRVRVVKILANPHECLIKSEAGFDANHGEVKGVGKSEAYPILTVPDHALQDESRQDEAESSDANHHRKIVETGKSNDRPKANQSPQDASTEVVIDVDGIAEPGLNHPCTSARDVGRGEGKCLANRVECLLETFADGRFVLGWFWLLTTERAEPGSEDGTWRDHGGAEGKHGTHHGEEHDNDKNQRP